MSNAEIAQRWIEGLAGDWSALAALSSPAMRVWHSSDGEWLDQAAAQARITEHAGAGAALAITFGDLRSTVTDAGFVVQATLDRDGSTVHVVQLLTVEDGLVASCEEYLAVEDRAG